MTPGDILTVWMAPHGQRISAMAGFSAKSLWLTSVAALRICASTRARSARDVTRSATYAVADVAISAINANGTTMR